MLGISLIPGFIPMSAKTSLRAQRTRINWFRLILWTPITLIGLGLLVALLTPSEAFFQGQVPGVYLLFNHSSEIIPTVVFATIITAATAVMIFFARIAAQRIVTDNDTVLAVVNMVIVVTVCLAYMVVIDWSLFMRHQDTDTASGHIYHLAALPCNGRMIDCESDGFLMSKYAVIDCGTLGIICQTVYLSEPIGWSMTKPVPHLSHDNNGSLQLKSDDAILWQSQ
jgi:hypothetical protein